MKLDDMKALAAENDIDFKAKATKPEMAKILFNANLIKKELHDEIMAKLEAQKDLNDDIRKDVNGKKDAPSGGKVQDMDLKLKKIKFAYREAESKLDLKRADQSRSLLRKEIELSEDTGALVKFLKFERSHQRITKADAYLLNSIERHDADQRCHQVNKISASGTHTSLGAEYDFYTYFDDTRVMDMYVIFVPKIIPPEFQIGKELAWKMSNGFLPEQKDFEKEKTLWHRLVMKETEFKKYYEILE
jgi:hypothetical protein